MYSTEELYKVFQAYPHIRTDTRKLQKDDIFFALKGAHFDGNKFVKEALEKGASFAVTDEPGHAESSGNILVVPDSLKALQDLAAYHRNQFNIPFLAITGSNGKTTTKELTYAVLQTTYKTHATTGNLNNHIGIPLTLLQIKKGTEIAIIEMGANHQKEIEGYCRIVRPTHGIITNIGKAHLEGFGGIEGVKKGKGELFDYLRSHRGTAFACADFPYFKEMSEGIRDLIWYGTSDKNRTTGKVVQTIPFLEVELNHQTTIRTQLAGRYNLYNILAAAVVGQFFGVDQEKIAKAIAGYKPGNSRSQVIKRGKTVIVSDAYNANPTSMRAAIEDFARRPEKKKYLFLGAMLELGKESLREHQKIIRLIEDLGFHEVFLVGGDFEKVDHPFKFYPEADALLDWFRTYDFGDCAILIKGSNSIGMEKLMT